MGWLDYYNLLIKHGGDLSKATKKEMNHAAKCNPNDPSTARSIAEEKYRLLNEVDSEQEQEGDCCIRCGNPIDHNDPHLYCSNCT